MSGGGSNAVAPSTQNVVQTSSPPPQFLQAYENIVNQAQGVASQPLQQYPGQIVAPLNSTQQQAFGDIQNAQGQAQPYINAAGQYFGAATQPLWNGVPQLDPSQISGAASNGIGYVNQAAGADISGAGASGIAAANNYAGTNINAAGQPGISTALNAAGTNIGAAGTTGINRAVTGANTNIGAAGQSGINAAYAGANTNIQGAGQQGINAAYAGANTDIGAAGQPGINAAMGAAYTNPNAVSSYLSPYIQNVVDTTQAQFNNQNAQNRNALAGKEVSEGAWGGDRNGVAAAELQNQEDLAQAPVIAGLQNTGYQSAMTALQQQEALEASTGISAAGLGQSAAQQRAALQESAGISAAGLGQSAAQEEGQLQSTTGIAAAGLGQTAAQQEAALQTQEGISEAGLGETAAQEQAALGASTGISAAGLAQSGTQAGATLGAQTNLTGAQLSQTAAQQEAALQAGAGTQDLGLFTGQQGAELGADEANSWLNSQAGFGQAALGTEAQNTNLTDISTLLQSGGLQQAQTQQELNVPYEQFQQEQAYPFQTTNFLAGIAEGTGSAAGGTSSSTSTTNPSTLSTVAGIGEAGLGLNQLGAFDGLFGSGSSGLTDNSNLSSYASGIGNALSPGFGLTPDLSSLDGLLAKGGAVKRDIGGSIPKTGADDFFLPGLDDIPDVSASYVPNTKPVVGMGPPKPPEIPRPQASGSSSGGGDSTVSDIMSLAKIGMTIASLLNRGGTVQKRDLGGGIGDFLDSGSLGLVPQFWNSGKGSDIEKILGLGGIAAGGGGGSSDMLKGLLGGGIGMLGLKDGGIAGDNDNHAPYPERRTGTHGGIAGHYDDGGDILDGPPPMPTPRPDLPTDTRAGMDAVTSQPTGIAAAAPVAPPAQNRYMPDYTPPVAPARSPSDNSTDYRKNAAGMALLTAGLGTLATGNIGRGGLEGVKSYQDQLKQASDIDEKQQTESDTGQYRLASMKQEGLRLSDAADQAKARLALADKAETDTQTYRGWEVGDAREKNSIERMKANAAIEEAKNPLGMVAPMVGADPTKPPVTGNDFLKTLPPNISGIVKAIATGREAPITGYGLTKPAGSAIMAAVNQYDPDFDATLMPTRARARSVFAGGPDGNAVKSLDAATAHLDIVKGLAAALDNGDVQAINYAKNKFKEAFGVAAPSNLSAANGIVGPEIVKAIVPGGGTAEERDRATQLLSQAKSWGQYAGAIDTIQNLFGGQVMALKKKYEFNTKLKDFDNMLEPPMQRILSKTEEQQAQSEAGRSGAPGAGSAQNTPSLQDIFNELKKRGTVK